MRAVALRTSIGAAAAACAFTTLLFFGTACRAAFELDALPPAERSCTAPDVLGLAGESVSSVFHTRRASTTSGAVGAYAFRPFGLTGIEVFALRGRATIRSGRAGVTFCVESLEAPGYTEQVVSLSVGISRGSLWLQPGLRVGSARAPGIYNGICTIVDFLTYTYVTPDLRVSFGVKNAFASRLDVTGGLVPVKVGAGLGYSISHTVSCGLRIEQENGLQRALSTGLEWSAFRGFFMRLGSRTFPGEFSLGLGVRVNRLSIDLASTMHLDLGMTHEAGVTYVWE
jgi:hypothetical protein